MVQLRAGFHAYSDLLVELDFLLIIFLGVERIETDVVVHKLRPNLLSRLEH